MTRENGLSLILLHRTDLPSSKRNRAALHQKAIKKRLKNWSCALTGASQVATGYRTCWEVPQWLGNISPRILSTQPKSHGSKTPTRSLRESRLACHTLVPGSETRPKKQTCSHLIFFKSKILLISHSCSQKRKSILHSIAQMGTMSLILKWHYFDGDMLCAVLWIWFCGMSLRGYGHLHPILEDVLG